MKRWTPFLGLIVTFSLIILSQSSCIDGNAISNEYNTKLDSVHLGVRLGMERQEFYDHCWDLNKQGQNITQGHHNTSVMHSDSVNFRFMTEINFYPEFNDDQKVYILPVRFEYKPWAPWNKEAYADQLLPEVINFIEKSYDITVEEKEIEGNKVWYNYDSPRLITIYTEQDRYVFVKFKNERFK